MELSDIVWDVKKDSIKALIKSGKRADGRPFDAFRGITMAPEYIPRAEGSCLVRLGDTQVLAGVKLGLGEPYPDTPDKGALMTNAELVPFASPTYEPGPPDESSIELARVVDRGIRESKMVDMEKLCIEEGKKVWMVMVDLHVLDYDGNLIDASVLASAKALLGARFPKLEGEKVVYSEKAGKLPVVDKPIACTFAKIGDGIVLDPGLGEEHAMDGRLTITTTQDERVCAVQKGGVAPFTVKEIEYCLDTSIAKGRELRKML